MLNKEKKRIMVEWIIFLLSGITLIYYYGGNVRELIKKILEWIFIITGTTLILEYFIKPVASKIFTRRKFSILDIIKKNNIITFEFKKISDNEAKKKVIEYLRKQIKKGNKTTDIFTISKSLKMPIRQVNRIIKKTRKPKSLNKMFI